MKSIGKSSIRNFGALLFVAVISCCAFVFLNTVQSYSHVKRGPVSKSGAIEMEEAPEKDNQSKLKGDHFPDILAAKRVFELMRKFIPAS